jgi:ribosomal protein L7/L12
MEAMQCPSCGSSDVSQVGYPEYQCAYCGTRFVPAQAPSGFVDIVLVGISTSKNKMDIIKLLRQLTNLDLREAVSAVDNPPVVIKESVPMAEGEKMKTELEKIGASITLKPA